MPLLEVIALHAADAREAAAGGADRLELVSDMESDGLSPSVTTVAAIRKACDIELRVMLRSRADFTVCDLDKLAALAVEYRRAGADGFVFGFLRPNGTMDTTAMRELGERVAAPWTCHRAVDHAIDYDAALSDIRQLSGLDQVLTAGHPDGLSAGIAAVCRNAATVPVMAGGGLRRQQLERLRANGVESFHIGSAARRSWNSPVQADLVSQFRLNGR